MIVNSKQFESTFELDREGLTTFSHKIQKESMSRLNLLHKTRLFSTTASGVAGKQEAPKKLGIFKRIWSSYLKSLEKHPLLTKGTTATLIFFTSDLGTQYITNDYVSRQAVLARQRILEKNGQKFGNDGTLTGLKFSLDYHRALSGAAFGLIGTGWLHFWWGYLEKAIELRIPVARYRLRNTLAKVAIDQSIGAPLYIYCYYYITSFFKKDLIREKEPSIYNRVTSAHARTTELLFPTMLKHWRVWPAVHTFNFYFVPFQHRVLIQNICLVGWSGYLSHLNHGSDTKVSPRLQRRDSSNIGLDIVEGEPVVSKAVQKPKLTQTKTKVQTTVHTKTSKPKAEILSTSAAVTSTATTTSASAASA